ncbi:VOC family protein [Jatrophihabitans sp.]|uniref:VOC family protein n=1 Tax=Jatrophihabitans sp. TaxID=1932789 RepID=UPI0030C7432C
MEIAGFSVADPPEAWTAAGFRLDADGSCRIGGVRVRLVGRAAGRGITGWALRGLPAAVDEVDGVPTSLAAAEPTSGAVHPNGVTQLDHAVLMTPDLDRTVTALAALGTAPRRERDAELGGAAVRQVFYRCGEVVLEVIGTPGVHGAGPATLWGLTHTVRDLDAAAALLGEAAGRVKDAVQPGRRITTLRHRELGMSVPTALISAVP